MSNHFFVFSGKIAFGKLSTSARREFAEISWQPKNAGGHKGRRHREERGGVFEPRCLVLAILSPGLLGPETWSGHP